MKQKKMKNIILLLIAITTLNVAVAQKNNKDTVPNSISIKRDTIRIGGLVIVTKRDGKNKPRQVDIIDTEDSTKQTTHKSIKVKKNTNKKVKTNWVAFDLGFNNYTDKTNYSDPAAASMLRAIGTRTAPTAADLKLTTGKSVAFNFWIVQQKVNLIKNYVGFKYGIGIEHLNYRYKTGISFKDAAPSYIFRDSVSFSKNKLGINYLTVPFLLTINPSGNNGFSISAGVSAGYRFSSYNKQRSGDRGNDKERGDFGLNPFKLSLTGDIGYNGLRFFGSYNLTPLHEKGLNFIPYTIGLRLSKW
jgi:hypothetical protein